MFVDIHSHLLPYIDDGATDIDCAFKMLIMAEAQGIKEMIVTPHYIRGVTNYSVQDVNNSYQQVAALIEKYKLDIKIHIGNEIFLDCDTISSLKSGYCLSLANSDYLLVELSNRWNNTVINSLIYELKIMGYKIVLAHIERYDYFIDYPEVLRKYIIDEGVYCQVNAAGITCNNKKTRKYLQKLIENDYVHFVATDAHNSNIRLPKLQEAYFTVESYIGGKAKELFCLNGEKVIANRHIEVGQPQKINKPTFFSRKELP